MIELLSHDSYVKLKDNFFPKIQYDIMTQQLPRKRKKYYDTIYNK